MGGGQRDRSPSPVFGATRTQHRAEIAVEAVREREREALRERERARDLAASSYLWQSSPPASESGPVVTGGARLEGPGAGMGRGRRENRSASPVVKRLDLVVHRLFRNLVRR